MLLYGLGNNAPKYLHTRHNVGRILLESLAETSFQKKNGYLYRQAGPHEHLLSAGFMNDSGLPLVEYTRYFKTEADTLLIFQDDSDQLEGRVKLVQGGGSAGHHGINSIYRHLLATPFAVEDVWRLKIGIRPEENRQKSETFVLKPVSAILTNTLTRLQQELRGLPEQANLQELQNVLNVKN